MRGLFVVGPIFRGAYIQGQIKFYNRKLSGLAYSWKTKFKKIMPCCTVLFLLCFILYLRAISKYNWVNNKMLEHDWLLRVLIYALIGQTVQFDQT